jgi:hypothetical protein
MGIRALILTRIVGKECHARTTQEILPLVGSNPLGLQPG